MSNEKIHKPSMMIVLNPVISYALIILMLSVLFSDASGQMDTVVSKKIVRQQKKQQKIEQGKPLVTPLAGPAYTPEMGFTIAGGIMLSFKTNPNDALIQRSSAPITLGVSATGAYFVSTRLTSYWLEDKLRINGDFWFKNMPDNYWGVGYEDAYNHVKSDSTTGYRRLWWWINPRILYQLKKNYFAGLNVDVNYTKASDINPVMQEEYYYQKYGPENLNTGLGFIARYDSRDVPVNAWKGLYVDLQASFYLKQLGGDNAYQVYQADIRGYQPLNREGNTVAFQVKGRFGTGGIPWAEMSQLGTPFDLRGYTWGRYRHHSMLFFLGEYRHMFLRSTGKLSPHGFVAWMGSGSIGEDVTDFENWLPSLGFGYRFEVQPRMNVRLDIGIGRETSGFYFNFNEAF